MPSSIHNLQDSIIVIGFGNIHYSDSSIGIRVADEVASWHLSEVLALTVRHLTPDLSEILAKVEVAIFVDASRAHQLHGIKIIPIMPLSSNCPESTAKGWMKTSEPYSLIALTQAAFGRYPQTYWIKVPADDFFLGNHISPIAEQGIEAALMRIESIIQSQKLVKEAC